MAADKAVIFSFEVQLQLNVESAFVWYNWIYILGGE